MTEWGSGIAAEAEYKREVLRRLVKARREGMPTGRIANESGYNISIHTIYDMLEAKSFPTWIWEKVDEGLQRLGY